MTPLTDIPRVDPPLVYRLRVLIEVAEEARVGADLAARYAAASPDDEGLARQAVVLRHDAREAEVALGDALLTITGGPLREGERSRSVVVEGRLWQVRPGGDHLPDPPGPEVVFPDDLRGDAV